jgi:DNA-directed RNA polymerase subunit RPC12/RpoP
MRCIVYVCSRCKAEVKDDCSYWQTFWAGGIEYDLCGRCWDAFKEFIQKRVAS